MGCISPALVGNAALGWPGALAGGAVTLGFRHTLGGESWKEAAVGSLLPTAFGLLLPSSTGLGVPVKVGLALALGAVGGMAVQARMDAHLPG